MSQKILLVCVSFGLALSACAPGVQAQHQVGTLSPNSTPVQVKMAEFETSIPTPTQTPKPILSPTAIKPRKLETSVLVTEWTGQEHQLYLLDTDRGQALPEFAPISLGGNFYHTFSPGGRTLAIATPFSLMLIDLAAWNSGYHQKIQRYPEWEERVFELRLGGTASGLASDPAGRRLAIVSGNRESQVAVFELSQEAIIAQASLDFLASRLKFT